MNQEQQAQLLELQQMQEHMEQLSKQQEMMQEQLMDIEISKNAIVEIGKAKVGDEVLTQLANGVFIKTELKGNDTFVVNVGADATASKTGKELIAMYEDQEKRIIENLKQLEGALEQLSSVLIEKISALEGSGEEKKEE